jgi:hypothetical protein
MSEPFSSLVSTKAPVSSLETTVAIAEGEDPTWSDKRPRKRGQWVGDKSITLQYEDIKVPKLVPTSLSLSRSLPSCSLACLALCWADVRAILNTWRRCVSRRYTSAGTC